ncbi:hypothetical protein ACHQM5_003600 [Ranunculus cassubicifolius]
MINIRPRFLLVLFILLYYLLHLCTCTGSIVSATIPFNVGVILDMKSWNGIMSQQCINMSVEDFYKKNTHYRTRVILHTEDAQDVGTAVLTAMSMVKDVKVHVIIGPQKSEQAEVVAELGNKYQVPVISFSATSPSLPQNEVPYFIRMAQNDTYQLQEIASFIKTFKWKEVILIYEETDYGNGIIPSLMEAFQTIDVRVRCRKSIRPNATDDEILKELDKLSLMPTRVFIVHMVSPLGPRFFLRVKDAGLMTKGSAWIITEGLTNLLGSMEDIVIDSMRGVIGIKPRLPRFREIRKFQARMNMKIFQETATTGDMNIFCLHAYDSIWAVALAAETIGINRSFEGLEKYQKKYPNTTDMFNLSLSEVGPQLLQEILNSKFEGVSGEVHIIDGKLQPIQFEIINVLETMDVRTVKDLSLIVWPGESTNVPKGVILPSGKKLKIGYPMKHTFTEFVGVKFDDISNNTIVTGYCIDVFTAVMKELPYDVFYEFVPFQAANGEVGISYEHFLRQVSSQKYDAVVGDITITADRSELVDFSHPYTQGGLVTVIRINCNKRSNLLTLFDPFTRNVWLSYFAVLAFTIFAIWSIEYTRGPGAQQIVSLFKIAWMLVALPINPVGDVRRMTQFVILLYIGLSGTLFSVFMQILTNMVLDGNGQLTAMGLDDLVKNGDFVGYQNGSVAKGYLIELLKFSESQLKVYNSLEEYDDALRKGSKDGGVSAIFDEIPYVRLFLNKFPDKYRRVGVIYGQQGFGFGFPIGSRLVPHVSTAISLLVEKGFRETIESTWLGSETINLDPPQSATSNALSMDKIWGLFVIVLILMFSAFLLTRIGHLENMFGNMLRHLFQNNNADIELEEVIDAPEPDPLLQM